MRRINETNLDIIKASEGHRSSVYPDVTGIWIIGFGSCFDLRGSRIGPDYPDIIEEEGEGLLRRELHHVERAIDKLIKAEITDNMHAAIGSFAYNCGTAALQRSTFRQYINQGRYEDASDELPRWCRAGGKKIPGLLRRRYAERELFLS
jgi:lysozyme